MADIISPERRSALMSRIKGKHTKPELIVRRGLFALGYRFRVHIRELPGRPDIAFTRRRAAILIHGCFWHRHGCDKTYVPQTRPEFWQAKFAQNVERDRRNEKLLREGGWRVFVVWECEAERDEMLLERLVDFLGPPRTE